MSASLSAAAMPCMIGFGRLPDLNSPSCLTRYSGCWPWMIGLAGLPREPSLVWQAAQTFFEVASPLARSGFAAGLSSSAANEAPVVASIAASSRQDSRGAASFMGAAFSCAKPGDFTMSALGDFMATKTDDQIDARAEAASHPAKA